MLFVLGRTFDVCSMKRLGRSTSPVVDSTLLKKESIKQSKLSVPWGILNLSMALMLYFEMAYGSVANYLHWTHPSLWYTECFLAAIFTVNTVIDLVRYLIPVVAPNPVELTTKQQKLLGVKDTDPGFKTSPVKPPATTSSDGTIHFSPSINSSFSPGSHYSSSHSNLSSPASSSWSPAALSSSTFSPISPLSPNCVSLSSSGQTFYGSPAYYGSQQSSFSRPPSGSPLFRDVTDGSILRSRGSSVRGSPMAAEDCITDLGSLRQFLNEQEEKDYKAQLAVESSPSSGPSYWTFNRSSADFTPLLRKYQYQIASRSPQATKSRNDDDPDHPSKYTGEEVWNRLGVHGEELELWIEKLRKWLSQTIMVRLVQQIGSIDQELARIGCEDMQIGEVSISTLKQLAVTKSQFVPTLNAVVPFLELSSNQEYLVHRLRELGQGGCMSDFNWNGGSEAYKGKPWGDHLPTDCAIVLHALCSYMDARLPSDPKYPDGKTFTCQHFMKTPDKPNLTKKEQILILQSKINPPHYKVIIGDDIWDLPKGRNNMFQAILLFLHHIKTKEHGMLSRVNLGLSGVNILWILDRKL